MKNIRASRKLMFLCSGALLAATAAGLAGQDSPAIAPAGHAELFNGRDFAGWTFFMKTNADPAKTWSIKDGVIVCTGRPTGYLATEQNYRDYKLSVEFRFTKTGNTGWLVHMAQTEHIWPKCIECQGQHEKLGDFWLHSGASAKGHEPQGPKSICVPMTETSNEKPPGEWNECEIVCRGASVKYFVNGKFMNELDDCNISSGRIGIQSEGAGIEVRKISLDPLPAM